MGHRDSSTADFKNVTEETLSCFFPPWGSLYLTVKDNFLYFAYKSSAHTDFSSVASICTHCRGHIMSYSINLNFVFFSYLSHQLADSSDVPTNERGPKD